MSKPRKEQISNNSTKFSVFSRVADSIHGYAEYDIKLGKDQDGKPVQSWSFLKDVDGLRNYYDGFLNSTVTKKIGGCEVDSPATIKSGNKGPYAIAKDQTFNIKIPTVNSGNTFEVKFGDTITIGGLPRTTTSMVVSAINSAYNASGGVGKLAYNDDGYVKLISPGSGADDSISLYDASPNILNMIGFTGGDSTRVVRGVAGGTRGVVTENKPLSRLSEQSQHFIYDDEGPGRASRGGHVIVKKLSGEPVLTTVSKMINVGGTSYPDVEVGNAVYGKITAIDNTLVNLSYYYTGVCKPYIITSGSNFRSITTTDKFRLILNNILDPNGYSYEIPIDFNFITPNPTITDIVNSINGQWGFVSEHADGNKSNNACVNIPNKEPYQFNGTESLVFSVGSSLDALSPDITVTPSVSVHTKNELANAISDAISAASQSNVYAAIDGGLHIYYGTSTGPSSIIKVKSCTEKIGITPGVYTGCHIAEVYGNDEIKLSSPMHGFSIGYVRTYSGDNYDATLIKLGLKNLIGTNASIEFLPSVYESRYEVKDYVKILVPEVVEFGEVSVDHEENIENFNIQNKNPKTDERSISDVGLQPFLNMLGKLDANVIPSILGFLGVKQLKVGDSANPSIPAIIDDRSGISYKCLFSDEDSFLRIYSSSLGLTVTVNARFDNSGNNWHVDVNGANSSRFNMKQQTGGPSYGSFEQLYANTSTFTDAGWTPVIQTNEPTSGGSLSLTNNVSSTLLNLNTNTTGKITLFQTKTPLNACKLRLIFDPATNISYLTSNAGWTGSNWTNDVSGYSTSIVLENGKFSVGTHYTNSITTWPTWTTYFSVDMPNNVISTPLALNVGSLVGSDKPKIITTGPIGYYNLVWCSVVDPTINSYFSAVYSVVGSDRSMFIITNSCYWSETNNKWNANFAVAHGVVSRMLTKNDGSVYHQSHTSSISGAISWNESEWDKSTLILPGNITFNDGLGNTNISNNTSNGVDISCSQSGGPSYTTSISRGNTILALGKFSLIDGYIISPGYKYFNINNAPSLGNGDITTSGGFANVNFSFDTNMSSFNVSNIVIDVSCSSSPSRVINASMASGKAQISIYVGDLSGPWAINDIVFKIYYII